MNPFSFPLRYLTLETGSGCKLWIRDLLGMIFVTSVISLPYIVASTANYFHKDGFVDKIGTFSSVLTGFYVAGLVAVATFPRNKAGLDKIIEIGKIRIPAKNEESPEYLTRREYVCYMFGYLAFLSMIITIISIVLVTLSPWYDKIKYTPLSLGKFTLSQELFRSLAILTWSLMVSSLLVTTTRSLYYLIDRLYAVVPTPLPRKEDSEDEKD